MDKIYVVYKQEYWEYYPVSFHKTLKGAQIEMEFLKKEAEIKKKEALTALEMTAEEYGEVYLSFDIFEQEIKQ